MIGTNKLIQTKYKQPAVLIFIFDEVERQVHIGVFYVPFINCQGRKGQFSSIFTGVLKRSRHFVLSKLSLFKNGTQHKLTCHFSLLMSQFQHSHRDYSGGLRWFEIRIDYEYDLQAICVTD